ncbi:MAG: putative membrane protein [Hyphomicrobiaceae bacterium]|jgi:uncharacterized membrane protein
MNKKMLLASAALGGFVLAATVATPSWAEEAATGGDNGAAMGECHGVNSCKGTGDCGGKGHSCAGKNECKGNGWIKASKADCETKGGEFSE